MVDFRFEVCLSGDAALSAAAILRYYLEQNQIEIPEVSALAAQLDCHGRDA